MEKAVFDPQEWKAEIIALAMTLSAMLTLISWPVDSLDARFFYTGHFATEFFRGLDSLAVTAYLRTVVVDLFFLFSYGTLMFMLARRLGFSSLALIALIPALLDLLETGTIGSILLSGNIPNKLDWLGIVTCIKWIAAFTIYLPLLYKSFLWLRAKYLRTA